ncbi:MAG TPA: hypothetical protein VKA84_27445 [Gemmatimonadaceae bacterium]|nr:hypothetical protein [Gemmatimonadaceae bacterium]
MERRAGHVPWRLTRPSTRTDTSLCSGGGRAVFGGRMNLPKGFWSSLEE